jgi:membrane-associated phospholipid phosphatase
MLKYLSSIFCAVFIAICPVRANDRIELAGDILAGVLPAAAAGMTVYLKDWTGTKQFGESVLLNEGVTWILKYTVKERRPNGEDYHSFPSSHTSISCASAEFMRKRYGWLFGVPMYAASAFVGYSRIESKHHYPRDVAAGAAIGMLSSFIFTKSNHAIEVSGCAPAGRFMVRCSGTF